MPTLPDCHAEPPRAARWWWHRANWLYESLLDAEVSHWVDDVEERRSPVMMATLGRLVFPDGVLVVADPYTMGPNPLSIVEDVKTLPYAVVVARSELEPGHRKIIAAMLVTGGGPVTSWEMARWPGQDPFSLGHRQYFGYWVETGTGCFAGARAAGEAGEALMDVDGLVSTPITRALEDGGPAAAALVPPERGGLPIAVFNAGSGPGCYPTWLGRDDLGEIVVVLTDFLVVGDPYAADDR